jgi:hypothetical protein
MTVVNYSKKALVDRIADIEDGGIVLAAEVPYTKSGWTGITEVDSALDDLKDNKVELPASATEVAASLTAITHTAPATPDYALQDLTDSGGFGFVTKDEGNSLLAVVANLQAQVDAMRTALIAAGICEAPA